MMTEHKRLRNSLKTKMLEITLLKTLISSVFFIQLKINRNYDETLTPECSLFDRIPALRSKPSALASRSHC